jgi:inhibitor of the pro-sigma K processing machinery
MGLQIGVLLTYAGVIIMIFIVGKLFVWPIKLVLKLVASSLIAGAAIVLINTAGTGLGIAIPLNVLNALTAGVLGIPGLVMLLIFSLF